MTEFICQGEREGGWLEAQAAQFTHNAATRRLATFNGFLNGERGYRGEWCFSANAVSLCAAVCMWYSTRDYSYRDLEKKQFCSKTSLVQKVPTLNRRRFFSA